MGRRPPLPVASLAVALLVVLAGCASLGGPATATDAPTTATTATTGSPATETPPATTDTTPATTTGANGAGDGSASNASDDTTVRASLVGVTATGLNLSAEDRESQGAIATTLGVDTRDVQMRPHEGTVEVFDANVSASALVDALGQHGIEASADQVRPGVTDATQASVVTTLAVRLSVLDIDASVDPATVDGLPGVVITSPGDGNGSRIRDAIRDRGQVAVVAHVPADGSGSGNATDGAREVTLLTNEDFEAIGVAQAGRPAPYVPVTVRADAAANFSSALVRFGFTDEGVSNCSAAGVDPANATGWCLSTVHDGEVVYAASVSPGLADAIESGEWTQDPRFIMTTTNLSAARELQAHLQAGALPTRVRIADRDGM